MSLEEKNKLNKFFVFICNLEEQYKGKEITDEILDSLYDLIEKELGSLVANFDILIIPDMSHPERKGIKVSMKSIGNTCARCVQEFNENDLVVIPTGLGYMKFCRECIQFQQNLEEEHNEDATINENNKLMLTGKGVIFVEAVYLKQALVYAKKASQQITSLKTEDTVVKDVIAWLQYAQKSIKELYDEHSVAYKQFGNLDEDIAKNGFIEE